MSESREPTNQEILEQLAGWVVKRRLTAPAILFLESHRPLSFVGSQAMIAAAPIVSFFAPLIQTITGPGFGANAYDRFAEMMEDRDNVELLIIEIERANQAMKEEERQEKARRKALKREARQRRKALRKLGNQEEHD